MLDSFWLAKNQQILWLLLFTKIAPFCQFPCVWFYCRPLQRKSILTPLNLAKMAAQELVDAMPQTPKEVGLLQDHALRDVSCAFKPLHIYIYTYIFFTCIYIYILICLYMDTLIHIYISFTYIYIYIHRHIFYICRYIYIYIDTWNTCPQYIFKLVRFSCINIYIYIYIAT